MGGDLPGDVGKLKEDEILKKHLVSVIILRIQEKLFIFAHICTKNFVFKCNTLVFA